MRLVYILVVSCMMSTLLGCVDKIKGCTNPYATNYNILADEDDGSCHFEPTFKVGSYYQGGYIIYVDTTGKHGLIVAMDDVAQSAPWSPGNNVTGSSGTTVGSGSSNTSTIVHSVGPGLYGASLCDELSLNDHSDWFLPSRDELYLIYIYQNLYGGFQPGPGQFYWTSTELNDSMALSGEFNMYSMTFTYRNKNSLGCVRPLRAF